MNDIANAITVRMDEMGLRFIRKPILVGDKAMECYGLRKAGTDIDVIICNDDYLSLEKLYPKERKDLYGDLGAVLWPFEIWRSIALLDYDFYKVGAVELDAILVVSFERLLFMRVIAREVEKYSADLDLMVEHIYLNRRNREYIGNAERHIASYQKNNGAIFSGNYDD